MERVDKTDGRNRQNIPVLPIVAHSFTHTSPTDAARLITTILIFFSVRSIMSQRYGHFGLGIYMSQRVSAVKQLFWFCRK